MCRDRNYIISSNQHLSRKLSILHLTLLQDTGNQSFVKSSHSIVQREETSRKEKIPIKLVTVSQE